MKIGAFAKKYQLNKTTIRYYTELNLLLPNTEGTYPDYDEQCEGDLEDILRFKEMGFSIEEIMTLKSKERFYIGLDGQRQEMLQDFLKEKILEHRHRIDDLNDKIQCIEDYKINTSNHIEKKRLGLSISALPFLICPKCKELLTIQNAHIVEGQILSGNLNSGCGQNFVISNGIIHQITADQQAVSGYDVNSNNIDALDNQHFAVIKNTGTAFHSVFREWAHEKGVLFINADTDIFMMGSQHEFRPEGIYLFASYSKKALYLTKEKLEKYEVVGHFVFVLYEDMLPFGSNIQYGVDIGGALLDKSLKYPGYALDKMKMYLENVEEMLYIAFEGIEEQMNYLDCYKEQSFEVYMRTPIDDFEDLAGILNTVPTESKGKLVLYHYKKC